jgi:hypothetical protein
LRNISIPIDLQLILFDTLILPILTYGCEIWGLHISIGVLPSSPYVIKFGIVVLTPKIFQQN